MNFFNIIKNSFVRRKNTEKENETLKKICILRIEQIDKEIKILNDEKEELLLHLQNLNLDF